MKNALILHGAGNDDTGNWFPWLKSELERKGYKVWTPDLPNADVPDKEKWLNTVFSNKEWVFDTESVIIGHSAGATLILRILEKLSEKVKINKAILVAGPVNMGTMPQYFIYKKSLLGEPFNWAKIKESCSKFYLIYSDKDPYDCGIDQGKIIQEHTGGELLPRNGQGHFNLEKGLEYKQFPLLLELIER
jgi:predicted alpha/beta hydrolase family esterase